MGALNGAPIVWYKQTMTNKNKIGISLIVIAALAFAFTINRSFFYSVNDDSGIKPVENASAVTSAVLNSQGTQDTTETTVKETLETINKGPTRILIPKLSIDAKVIHVGVTANGNMDAPHNFVDTGWYKYGTLPGKIGSAVIDGHEDNGVALDGVFKHLDKLVPGDDVYVVQADGTKLHFKVEVSEVYPYDNSPLQKIFARTDAARLNLITCAGDWLPEAKTNDKRLVIYTKLVND